MNVLISEGALALPGGLLHKQKAYFGDDLTADDTPRIPPVPEQSPAMSNSSKPVKVFDRLFEDANRRIQFTKPSKKSSKAKKPKKNYSHTIAASKNKKIGNKSFLDFKTTTNQSTGNIDTNNIETLITSLYCNRYDSNVSPILHSIQDIDDYLMREKAIKSPLRVLIESEKREKSSLF